MKDNKKDNYSDEDVFAKYDCLFEEQDAINDLANSKEQRAKSKKNEKKKGKALLILDEIGLGKGYEWLLDLFKDTDDKTEKENEKKKKWRISLILWAAAGFGIGFDWFIEVFRNIKDFLFPSL